MRTPLFWRPTTGDTHTEGRQGHRSDDESSQPSRCRRHDIAIRHHRPPARPPLPPRPLLPSVAFVILLLAGGGNNLRKSSSLSSARAKVKRSHPPDTRLSSSERFCSAAPAYLRAVPSVRRPRRVHHRRPSLARWPNAAATATLSLVSFSVCLSEHTEARGERARVQSVRVLWLAGSLLCSGRPRWSTRRHHTTPQHTAPHTPARES